MNYHEGFAGDDVRGALLDARPVGGLDVRLDFPQIGEPYRGVEPGQWTPGPSGLPGDCPVVPLGVSGNIGWFIDPIGQLQQLAPPYGKGHLLGLFCGAAGYLAWAWPRWGKKGVDGYAAETAAAALLSACAQRGPWDNVERVRGRGTWLVDDGKLLVHTGVDLLSGPHKRAPGMVDLYVYPARPPIPGPVKQKIPHDRPEIQNLKALLNTWNWARPGVDPMLLLGWVGAAFLAGALPWRPTIYITGDKATGKSKLQELVKKLLGNWLVQAADTSAAGVYQRVGCDCLPVAVDELEGEANVQKQRAILKLARLAASGALMLRGGEKHVGVEFQARSCFLFSSINTPPLEPQDLSRMAILRLGRLPTGQQSPKLDAQTMAMTGAFILRRLLDEWHRFPETWDAFREELGAGGMDGRGQDTFGTLLACADMILHTGWDAERLKADHEGDLVSWRDILAREKVVEFEDATENWRLCLSHMLSVTTDYWRNTNTPTAGSILEQYFKNTSEMDAARAKQLLAKAGLTIVKRKGHWREEWLAVPNQGSLTRTLFVGSKWAGDLGAGVWAGALRQADDGICETGPARVNGVLCKCTLVSLERLYGDGGAMAAEAA